MEVSRKKSIEKGIVGIENINVKEASIKEIEKLFSTILDAYKVSSVAVAEGTHIFRGRICSKPKQLKEISYPPKEFVREYGRLNDIGQSMFYGSVGRGVPVFELNAKVGDTLIMSLWKTKKQMVLNHAGFNSEAFQRLNSNRSLKKISEVYKFINDTLRFNDLNAVVYNYLAKVFTRKVNKYNSDYYKISIALSNVLLNSPLFDGIMYPSIAMSANSENIVLKPEFVDENLELVNVKYVEVTSFVAGSEYKTDTLDTATSINSNGEIQWTGRQFAFTYKAILNEAEIFEYQNDGWVRFDKNGKAIYPQSTGPLIKLLTPLGTQYKNDFPDNIKMANEDVTIEVDGNVIPITVTLQLQYVPPNRFLTFYLPIFKCPLDACISLFANHNKWIDMDKDHEITHHNLTNKSLPLSNTIYFYSEAVFDPAELTSRIHDPTFEIFVIFPSSP